MKGCKCGSNVGMFRDASGSAGKCIIYLLNEFNLCERMSEVKSYNNQDESGRGKLQ